MFARHYTDLGITLREVSYDCPPSSAFLSNLEGLSRRGVFLHQRIVFHTVLQSGLMNQHFHILGIVEEVLVWHSVSREDDVTMFFTHKKTSVRLGAVVDFHGNNLFKGHFLL